MRLLVVVVVALVTASYAEPFLTKLKKLSKRNVIPFAAAGGGMGCGPQMQIQPLSILPLNVGQGQGQMMLRQPQVQPQAQVVYLQQSPYYQQALQYGSSCASCLSNSYVPSCYQTCSGMNSQCIGSCSPQCQSSCFTGYPFVAQSQTQPQLHPQLQPQFQPQFRQTKPVLY